MIILITGASEGIGAALVKELGQNHRILPISRTGTLGVPPCDVNDPDKVVALLQDLEIDRINVVVHNAAVGYYGDHQEQDPEALESMVQTNLIAPIVLTHVLFPYLQAAIDKNEQAHIGFVSSAHATQSTPLFAAYTACKAGLNGFARSLQAEWQTQHKIRITQFLVGPTNTGMHEKIGLQVKKNVKAWFMSPESVAKKISKAIINKKTGIVKVGGLTRAITWKGGVRKFAQMLSSGLGVYCSSKRHDERVVVTGGNGGIGKEYMKVLGKGAINADLEPPTKEETHNFVALDLTSIDAIKAAAMELPLLDGVVMNAGVNVCGHFEDIPIKKHIMIIRVNFLGPMILMNELKQQGKVTSKSWALFMSSLSYFVGYPGAASYAAAKDGIASFADSIGATAVFPGPTKTPMASACSPDDTRESQRMDPKEVATKGVRGARRSKSLVIPGLKNGIIAFAGFLFPNLLTRAMKSLILDKIESGKQLEIQIPVSI